MSDAFSVAVDTCPLCACVLDTHAQDACLVPCLAQPVHRMCALNQLDFLVHQTLGAMATQPLQPRPAILSKPPQRQQQQSRATVVFLSDRVDGLPPAPVGPVYTHRMKGVYPPAVRAAKIARYLAKRARRLPPVIRYKSRKDFADARPRRNGRFVPIPHTDTRVRHRPSGYRRDPAKDRANALFVAADVVYANALLAPEPPPLSDALLLAEAGPGEGNPPFRMEGSVIH